MRERIVVLDGAMGTMIQGYKLSEADYRGDTVPRLARQRPQRQPRAIEPDAAAGDRGNSFRLSQGRRGYHRNQHLQRNNHRLARFPFPRRTDKLAAKIRNSFSAWWTMPVFARLVHEINFEAARIARHAADRAANETGQQRFVGGSMGPLPVAGSLSPDVNDPAFRAVSFDQLRQTYFDQAKALLEGGVDLLIVETIFDTLNGKAALFAITDALAETGRSVPLMISGTVIDKSGRNLSGQTVEAFLVSIAHARPLIVGLNCALGPDEMEPFIEELSRIAPFYVSAYPNAGLPDPLSPTGFPETAESFAPKLAAWAANGWLNIVGGCCGTTPEHIRAIADRVRDCKPRVASVILS